MSTYTVRRVINSVAQLTNYLSVKGKVKVSWYVTDPATRLVTLSLAAPADTILLDTLVASYVDSPALRPEDNLAFRYFRAYRSTDLTLTTSLNTVNPISLPSLGVADLNYYTPASDRSFISISKPGVYLLIAKVGAYSTSLLTSSCTVHWFFQADISRTGGTWTTLSNASAYTLHGTSLPAADTTTLACTYNVTGVHGAYVRLACRVIAGAGGSLAARGDLVSVQIMNASGACYYEGTSTSTTALTTTPTALPLNSDRILNPPFTHTLGSPSVTVTASGTVFIIAKVTVSKTSGTDASHVVFDLLVNDTVHIGNGKVFGKRIAASGHRTTVINSGTLSVVAGDVISTRVSIASGTNLSLTSGDSGLMIMYLSTVNHVDNLFTGDVAINAVQSSTVVTATPLDVQFESQTESFPNYSLGVTFTGTTTYLTTNTTGYFSITGDMSFFNPTSTARTVCVAVSVSMESVFYTQPGTLSMALAGAGKTTINTQHLLFLTVNSKIKLIVYSPDASSLDEIQVSDCTNLSVQCFNGATMGSSQPASLVTSNFGENFYFVSSLEADSFTSTSFVEKTRLSPGFLAAGMFRVHLEATLTPANSLDTYTIQLVDTVVFTSSNAQTSVLLSQVVDYTTTAFRRTLFLWLQEGVHSLVFQIASPRGSSIVCSNLTIEMWRVS